MVQNFLSRQALGIPISIALALLAGGCGLAHVEANVPAFEVSGRATTSHGNPAKLTIVEAGHYSEDDAFLALLVNKPRYFLKTHAWKEAALRDNGAFRVELPKQRRYIGFVILPPRENTLHRRLIFVRLASDQFIFRLGVTGTDVRVEKIKIAHARLSMPPSMAKEYPGHELNRRFYDSLKWSPATNVRLVNVSRSKNRDVLKIEIGR